MFYLNFNSENIVWLIHSFFSFLSSTFLLSDFFFSYPSFFLVFFSFLIVENSSGSFLSAFYTYKLTYSLSPYIRIIAITKIGVNEKMVTNMYRIELGMNYKLSLSESLSMEMPIYLNAILNSASYFLYPFNRGGILLISASGIYLWPPWVNL